MRICTNRRRPSLAQKNEESSSRRDATHNGSFSFLILGDLTGRTTVRKKADQNENALKNKHVVRLINTPKARRMHASLNNIDFFDPMVQRNRTEGYVYLQNEWTQPRSGAEIKKMCSKELKKGFFGDDELTTYQHEKSVCTCIWGVAYAEPGEKDEPTKKSKKIIKKGVCLGCIVYINVVSLSQSRYSLFPFPSLSYITRMSNNGNIYFDQGVMKLFRYDPSSNRYETQVLRLPDPPALESLEHLFCEPMASRMRTRSASKSRFAEVFETRHFRRLQKSSSSASALKPTSTRLPRRCYSSPSLKKTQSTASSTAPTATTVPTAHAPSRRSSSKRLSHAFQQLVTGLMRRQKKRSYRNEWHTETWIAHMREEDEQDADVDMSFSLSESSSLVEEPPLKKKRQHENWWAASPPLASAPMMLVA